MHDSTTPVWWGMHKPTVAVLPLEQLHLTKEKANKKDTYPEPQEMWKPASCAINAICVNNLICKTHALNSVVHDILSLLIKDHLLNKINIVWDWWLRLLMGRFLCLEKSKGYTYFEWTRVCIQLFMSQKSGWKCTLKWSV